MPGGLLFKIEISTAFLSDIVRFDNCLLIKGILSFNKSCANAIFKSTGSRTCRFSRPDSKHYIFKEIRILENHVKL